MWGIIPAAGSGSRIQPLAFSKELLPVGSREDGGVERPRAASEYLLERMVIAGADKLCLVISPGKWDILQYYGASFGTANLCYSVQPKPAGLCDAIFRAVPLIPPAEPVVVGLPDTIWFPEDGLRWLPDNQLSFLLFPVSQPELFDAVVTDREGRVLRIQVKEPRPDTHWVWGAFKLSGALLRELFDLWRSRDSRDEYLGTLVNEFLTRGGHAWGVRAGSSYVDVGTLNGYRQAMKLLADGTRPSAAPGHIPTANSAVDQTSESGVGQIPT
jgi:glucose-1-phosphate thymidylyltransferase